MSGSSKLNRYGRIIERVFLNKHVPGAQSVPFERHDIALAAAELGIELPKNLGDLLYSFRYRSDLPAKIARCAPRGKQWVILPRGRSCYAFVATEIARILPRPGLAVTKIPNATPGVIDLYSLDDEQALLAQLRYNRLLDIFTGVTCYSLQSHLRTTVSGIGQIETDEVYIGMDRHGAHYVFPVQAKGGRDSISVVQIAQDFAMCETKPKFRDLVCRPVAAQFLADGVIALFEVQRSREGFAICEERHYRLVPAEALSPAELAAYRARLG